MQKSMNVKNRDCVDCEVRCPECGSNELAGDCEDSIVGCVTCGEEFPMPRTHAEIIRDEADESMIILPHERTGEEEMRDEMMMDMSGDVKFE